MRGFNALQLALGSVGAGIGGYQAAQAKRLEEERLFRAEQRELDRILRDEERQNKMDERQQRMDDASMRAEERAAVASGMVEAAQYRPYGIAGGRDMPGATPRQPVFRQQIGEKEFVLPESPTTTKHRESVMGKVLDGAGKDLPYQWSDKYGVFLDRKTGKVIRPEDLPSYTPTAGGGGRGGGRGGPKPPSYTQLTKETEGLSFLQEYANDQNVIKRVGAAIADNPALAESPGLIGYGILQDYKKRGLYTKGGTGRGAAKPAGRAPSSAPPGAAASPTATRTPSAPPQRDEYQDLRDAFGRGG